MGVVWAYVALTPFMVLVRPLSLGHDAIRHVLTPFVMQCILAALVLGNVNVTKERNAERDVVDGAYLLHCLRNRGDGIRPVDTEHVAESGGEEVAAA